MSRETENTLLLLIGVATAMITLSGAFTRYVKSSLMPWLIVTAVVLIGLAIAAIASDIRHGADAAPGHDGHGHARLTWLLLIPVVMLTFLPPPALRPQASVPSVSAVSTDVLRRPFPPLPDGRAPEISVPEVMIRAAQDSAGTLDDRLITVIGFTLRDGQATDLGRFSVLCCAADARLARVQLDGAGAAEAARYPEYTWVRVEGKIRPGNGDGDSTSVPTLEVESVTEIEAPDDVYS